MTLPTLNRPTWAEIDLDNIPFNLRSLRSFIGKEIEIMAVVKADAYGHGAAECAEQLEADGADLFGVAIPEEGIELRRAGVTNPIVTLGGFWHGQESLILENQLTPTIFRIENAEWLNAAAQTAGVTASIHVKVDTGMGRVGIQPENVPEFADRLKTLTNLNVEGLMTHFASADDLSENDFTNEQMRKLHQAVDVFREKGFRPAYVDMANSPGAIAHPASRSNMVRLGGLLFGFGGDVLPDGIPKPELKPVMSLRSRITHLKRLPAGRSLGYGRTFVTNRDSLIATVPIGYHDGYPRLLSNRGRAIVNGALCFVAGRVSMDWTILDVTDVADAAVDDEVIFIGEDNGLAIRAEDLAADASTISYEITCGIGQRVPRQYVRGSRRD